MLWGLALSTKAFGRTAPPPWLLDLHRHLGGLAVVFTGVHLAGLALDHYVYFGTAELLVPFASQWKPDAVAWGVVAMYVLVAIEATSLLQRRIPRRWWRRTHYASFPLYVLATVHLATAGTDGGVQALQWTALASTVVIVLLTLIRAAQAADKRAGRAERGSTRVRSAGADAGQATTPAARSASTRSARPSSARTSSVCSPSVGAGAPSSAGVEPNWVGWRGSRV